MRKKEVTIILDAEFDLSMAGHPTDEASVKEFTRLYLAAAEKLSEERGIEIEVIECHYDDPDDHPVNDPDNAIWQTIHDMVTWPEEEEQRTG